MANAKAVKAPKAPKAVVPTDKQLAVLDALGNGRKISVETNDKGKKSVTLLTSTGKPVKDAPKLDRVAIETCQKRGWISEGVLSEEGKKAKKVKK